MSTINKTNVVNGNTILANDILNVINALDGTAGNSIVITADLKQGNSNTTDNVTSHAEGDATTATGTYSHAEGLSTRATGDYSHAEGGYTISSGAGSHTEGIYTTASGQYSHAEGISTKATGFYSHAEGDTTTATGTHSHAEGAGTTATGNYSHAEGTSAIATGNYSHAEGSSTQAIGDYSHAEGNSTQAIGDLSHAEGINTLTGIQTAYSSSVGISGLVILDAAYGDVTANFTVGGLLYLYDDEFDGNYGKATFTIDTVSYSAGKTRVQLVDPDVETTKAYVGDLTYLIGNLTFGGNKTIPGNYSHAEGTSTFAIGDYSHAEGQNTQAIGGYSHAEGSSTQAIGEGSHAEGYATQAIGNYSHAEGYGTQAIGNWSYTKGLFTQAIGDYSYAEGTGTIASGSYQHVSGKYNKTGDTTSLLIVGSGIDEGSRKDAFKVRMSGSIVIPTTQSIVPAWTGVDGEIVPATVGGVYRLYMYMNGAWRSSSFA